MACSGNCGGCQNCSGTTLLGVDGVCSQVQDCLPGDCLNSRDSCVVEGGTVSTTSSGALVCAFAIGDDIPLCFTGEGEVPWYLKGWGIFAIVATTAVVGGAAYVVVKKRADRSGARRRPRRRR